MTSHRAHRCESWLTPIPENRVTTNPEQLILSKTYPTSGYNLAHISRHAIILAGGYLAENND